jgi:hypothetical protein
LQASVVCKYCSKYLHDAFFNHTRFMHLPWYRWILWVNGSRGKWMEDGRVIWKFWSHVTGKQPEHLHPYSFIPIWLIVYVTMSMIHISKCGHLQWICVCKKEVEPSGERSIRLSRQANPRGQWMVLPPYGLLRWSSSPWWGYDINCPPDPNIHTFILHVTYGHVACSEWWWIDDRPTLWSIHQRQSAAVASGSTFNRAIGPSTFRMIHVGNVDGS